MKLTSFVGLSFVTSLLLTPPVSWCSVQAFVYPSFQSQRTNKIRKIHIWNVGSIIQQSQGKQLRRLSNVSKKQKCPHFLTIIDDAQEKRDTRVLIAKFKEFTEMFHQVLSTIEAKKESQKQLKEGLTKFEWNVKCLAKVKDMLDELEQIKVNANRVQARISKLSSTLLTLQPFIEDKLVPMKVKLQKLEIDIKSEQKRWDADEKDTKKRIDEQAYKLQILDGEIEIVMNGINTIQAIVTTADAEIGKTKQNVQAQVDQWVAKRKTIGDEFRLLQYQMQFIKDKTLGDENEEKELDEDDEEKELDEDDEEAKNELLQFVNQLETMEKFITEGDETMETLIADTKAMFNIKDKELAQARQVIKDELSNFIQESEKALLLRGDVEIQLEGRMMKSILEVAQLHRNLSETIAQQEEELIKKKTYKEKAFNHFMEIKSMREKKNVARLETNDSLKNQRPTSPQQQPRKPQRQPQQRQPQTQQQPRQPQTQSSWHTPQPQPWQRRTQPETGQQPKHAQSQAQPQPQPQQQPIPKKQTQQSQREEVTSNTPQQQQKQPHPQSQSSWHQPNPQSWQRRKQPETGQQPKHAQAQVHTHPQSQPQQATPAKQTQQEEVTSNTSKTEEKGEEEEDDSRRILSFDKFGLLFN